MIYEVSFPNGFSSVRSHSPSSYISLHLLEVMPIDKPNAMPRLRHLRTQKEPTILREKGSSALPKCCESPGLFWQCQASSILSSADKPRLPKLACPNLASNGMPRFPIMQLQLLRISDLHSSTWKKARKARAKPLFNRYTIYIYIYIQDI